MTLRAERGFTLIEVVVAFAIFALCVGALFEAFGGAVRRSLQAQDREQALLTAQSLLSQLRATPAPWDSQESGRADAGWLWQIDVQPFDAGTDQSSSWRAFEVSVQVRREGTTREIVLKSIEVARIAP
jgi:general secretion pathway protein I